MPKPALVPRETPRTPQGRRDPQHVESINMRMGDNFVLMMDKLCAANRRSRREIVEILISEAYEELEQDEYARINPA
jgi:hypothetical protein